jgi:hypothetical protein
VGGGRGSISSRPARSSRPACSLHNQLAAASVAVGKPASQGCQASASRREHVQSSCMPVHSMASPAAWSMVGARTCTLSAHLHHALGARTHAHTASAGTQHWVHTWSAASLLHIIHHHCRHPPCTTCTTPHAVCCTWLFVTCTLHHSFCTRTCSPQPPYTLGSQASVVCRVCPADPDLPCCPSLLLQEPTPAPVPVPAPAVEVRYVDRPVEVVKYVEKRE